MMRLVFLFCAEERELIPSKPFPVYEQNYSVSTISKQLRELADQHGEELLERRYDAWPRFLAAFRLVHGGCTHPDLYLPAYGGNLFDPDRFPVLEGRTTTTNNTNSMNEEKSESLMLNPVTGDVLPISVASSDSCYSCYSWLLPFDPDERKTYAMRIQPSLPRTAGLT